MYSDEVPLLTFKQRRKIGKQLKRISEVLIGKSWRLTSHNSVANPKGGHTKGGGHPIFVLTKGKMFLKKIAFQVRAGPVNGQKLGMQVHCIGGQKGGHHDSVGQCS